MNQLKRFSQIFKLSAGKVQIAFGLAKRLASIDGARLLGAPSSETTFVIAITRLVKGSVLRNKLRRRLKAALHKGIKTYGHLPVGTWLCVIYPSASNRSYQELETFVHSAVWKQKKTAL